MTARIHRPRARLAPAQVVAAVAVASVVALLLGGAAHVVTRALFRVDLLVPLVIGLGAGALMAGAVRRLRVSRPLVAASLAAAAAVGALATELVLDYGAARDAEQAHLEETAQLRGAMGAESRAARERVVRAQMEDWTLARYAAGRIGLDDSGRLTGSTPTLGRAGAVAVSLIEVLVAALCGWMIAGRAASEPACPACGRWRVARALPEARQGIARPLVDRLLAGEDVAGLVERPDTRERTLLALYACSDHDAVVCDRTRSDPVLRDLRGPRLRAPHGG